MQLLVHLNLMLFLQACGRVWMKKRKSIPSRKDQRIEWKNGRWYIVNKLSRAKTAQDYIAVLQKMDVKSR